MSLAWSSAPGGASTSGPNACGLRMAGPKASAAAHVSYIVGVDAVVLAGGAGQVPAVHDQVEAEEPADALFEGGATGEPVELGPGHGRIVESRLDDTRRRPPGPRRIVVDGRDVAQLAADEPEEHALGVHHVTDEIARRPVGAG